MRRGLLRGVLRGIHRSRLGDLRRSHHPQPFHFATTSRHHLYHHGTTTQVFTPDLTDQQKQILGLLGLPSTAYTEKH